MGKKVSDGSINSLLDDWGRDSSSGLPYSGAEVQRYIKSLISDLQDKTRFYYYSEAKWDACTNYDSCYIGIPEGLIFIYEGQEPTPPVPPPGPSGDASYDPTTKMLVVNGAGKYGFDTSIFSITGDASYDSTTKILVL